MTREEFIKILDRQDISYNIEGGRVVIDGDYINLGFLESIPRGIEFINTNVVDLHGITHLPSDIIFNSGWDVYLDSLTSISTGVVFKNGGGVILFNLIGEWFYEWKGNIEGISPNRLLNNMISLGLFNR